MNEPLYRFVKGKGWVTSPSDHILKLKDGHYYIVERKPDPGERYTIFHTWDIPDSNEEDRWLHTDKSPNYARMQSRWSRQYYSTDFSLYREDADHTDVAVYITLVPCTHEG